MLPVNETEDNWTEWRLSESLTKAWTDPVKPGQKSGVACLSAASTRTSLQISNVNSLASISSCGSFNDGSSGSRLTSAFNSLDDLPDPTLLQCSGDEVDSVEAAKTEAALRATAAGIATTSITAAQAQAAAETEEVESESPCTKAQSNIGVQAPTQAPAADTNQVEKSQKPAYLRAAPPAINIPTRKAPKTLGRVGPAPKSHCSPSPGASPCPSGRGFGSDTEDESQQQAKTGYQGPSPKSHWSPSPCASNNFDSDSDSDFGEESPTSPVKRGRNKPQRADSPPMIKAFGNEPPPAGVPFQRRRSGACTESMMRSFSKELPDPGSPGSGESPVKLNEDKPPVFDSLTIRTWFMIADKDNSGLVTKKDFINFLISHTDLATLLMKNLGEKSGEHTFEWHVRRFGETENQRVARVYRRLLGFYKTIDVDKNNCLDFDEFLDLFQRAGCVLEYKTVDNPRDRAADILESLEGKGPVDNVRVASQLARRGSEQLWALDQQRDFKCSKLPARRHSTQGLMQQDKEPMSPSDFWGETLVLGSSALKRRTSTEARKAFSQPQLGGTTSFRRRSWGA